MTVIAVLIIAGFLLIFAETILMWGVLFAAGAIAFAVAAALAFFNSGIALALAVAFFFVLACTLAMLLWSKIIPKTKLAKDIYLQTASDGKSPSQNLEALVNREGLAKTPLVPSGVVEIDGVCADASCENGHCEVGAKILATAATSFGLRVRKL